MQQRRGWPWVQFGWSMSLEWSHIELAVPHLSPALQAVRIVHLSDLHLKRRWPASLERVLERLHENPPHLLLITGDFVEDLLDHRPALPLVRRFAEGLRARWGVFAIAGNHDGDLLGPRLPGWGIEYIDRRYVCLGGRDGQAAIELIGLPGVRRSDLDAEFLEGIPPRLPGVPRIVLGHFPDQVRVVSRLEADLMLAGHTHGGQICLPGGRALMSHDSLPKHMARGQHRFGRTLLVVSRGLGTTRFPIRAFCPPQVVEITLTRARAEQ
ncbi:metallophosphoesterase [Fontivita pretiosa]|uniref:metallophosphoesterase n=1 Tax=Fontivita pretiosa TaxID=2989684 RepID=UPI003D16B5B6